MTTQKPKATTVDWENMTFAQRYTMETWLAAEALHAGNPVPGTFPEYIKPHPNEVATRAAVDAGIYTAGEAGL